jgi:hypothetical protein
VQQPQQNKMQAHLHSRQRTESANATATKQFVPCSRRKPSSTLRVSSNSSGSSAATGVQGQQQYSPAATGPAENKFRSAATVQVSVVQGQQQWSGPKL